MGPTVTPSVVTNLNYLNLHADLLRHLALVIHHSIVGHTVQSLGEGGGLFLGQNGILKLQRPQVLNTDSLNQAKSQSRYNFNRGHCLSFSSSELKKWVTKNFVQRISYFNAGSIKYLVKIFIFFI